MPNTNERDALIAALKTIEAWELPPTGKFWDEERTRPTSYETEYGSNGARDYIRAVARDALAATAPNAGAPLPLAPSEGVRFAAFVNEHAALLNASQDDASWGGYLAGIIETYLNFGRPKEEREAAIAGIIARRLHLYAPQQATLPASEAAGYAKQETVGAGSVIWFACLQDGSILRDARGVGRRFKSETAALAALADARAQPQADAAEPVAKKPAHTNSCRMENGRCGACGGDWSVCGCQGMFDRLAATQAPSAAKKEGQP